MKPTDSHKSYLKSAKLQHFSPSLQNCVKLCMCLTQERKKNYMSIVHEFIRFCIPAWGYLLCLIEEDFFLHHRQYITIIQRLCEIKWGIVTNILKLCLRQCGQTIQVHWHIRCYWTALCSVHNLVYIELYDMYTVSCLIYIVQCIMYSI